MSKHTKNSGFTGFRWLRSLLEFRHRNPAARFVSTVLAFAMATLLVVGSGVAYGDGTSTPSGATTPSADTTTPSTDPTSTADPTPTSNPAPATEPAPTTTSATTTTSSSSTTSGPKTFSSNLTTQKVIPNSTINGIDVPCDYTAPGAANVPAGSFEIDGNSCLTGDTLTGSIDWDTVDFASDAADQQNDGFEDSTTFTQGDSENNDPSTWHINGPKPNGKSDIGTAMAYSQISGGKVYGYFAFTNSSTSGGTQQYDVEYNQNDATLNSNGALVPVRVPGDLLFRFHSTGAAPLVFDDAKIYTLTSDSAWKTTKNPATGEPYCFAITGASPAAGWCDLPANPNAFTMKSSADGLFQEGAIDISSFFPTGTCSGDFSTTQIRSVTGNSFATSALKDYVHPLAVHTPSTCGKLVIKKADAASDPANPTLVGGAVFSITGDPRPGADSTKTLCVYDGPSSSMPTKPAGCDVYIADGTADGTITIDPVEPGTYSVTELVPPPGYMLAPNPPGNTQSVTVGDSQTKTLTFSNYKIWKGLTAIKTANPTYRAQYDWSINKEISADGSTGWSTSTTSGSPLLKTIPAGSATNLFYRVTVTEGARSTSQYKVSGSITVSNPSDNVGSMDAVVTDELSGATCLVDGASSKNITVAKGASVPVPYVCTFAGTPTAGQLAGTNTAHVTWDRSSYPQVVGDLTDVGGTTRQVDPTATYDFANAAVTEVDKTVTVTDNQHTFVPAWTITWSGQGTTHTSDVYSRTPSVSAGSCSAVLDNTATITGSTTGVLGTDSAYGKVCVGADLVVAKNKTVSMTRTYLWQILKTRTSAANITSGDSASYSVTVSRGAGLGYEDSGWQMTGVITVTNPNNFEPITMTSLVDQYNGDKDGANSCQVTDSRPVGTTTWGAVDYTLQKNDGSSVNAREYKYTCTFTNKPTYDGTNTATANWDGSAATTPNSTAIGTAAVTTANWELAATPVNKVITVSDNRYTGGTGPGGHVLGTVDWSNAPQTFTYSIPWTVPAGTCADKDNTATIVETGQYSSATVNVCNPVGLTIRKVDVQTGSTVTGAHFRIWAGTDTSAAPVYNDLAEGDAADKDPTAGDGVIRLDTLIPGTYTVREIQAPSGYTIAPACDATHTAPNCDTQTVVLGAAGAQTLSFNDLKPWSPLTAKKTAQGDYDTHYDWSIAKAVRHGNDAFGPTSSYNSSNATENFDWKVSIGEAGRTESNWKVSGAITISNPNSASVLATVSESLTPCTIYDPADTTPPLTPLADASAAAGFQVSVPADGGGTGTVYQYLCTQTSKAATSNTATVSVNRHDYPRSWDDWFSTGGATYDAAATAGGTLSPSITWTEHNPDGSKTITVTDVLQGTSTTHLNSGAPWTHTYGDHAADPTWNSASSRYEHVYSSPVTATAGSCASVTNTAAITGTALTASATATHCTGADLAVSKNKTVSMTRTYLWQIQKTRTSAASIISGQSADYSVTVSRADGLGYADSGWQMTGVITVTNPNNFEPVTMTSLVDQYNGDNDGANSCQVTDSRPVGSSTWGAVNYTLQKNDGSSVNAREYKYTCTFTNKPDYGLPGPARANIATATWDAAAAATPNGTATGSVAVVESDWTLAATPVNKVITVVDNQYTGGTGTGGHTLGTLDWDNAPHTYTYSMPWTAPAGTCVDRPNTATIVETAQDSSATVEVCNPLDLGVSKTATGSYTRTYQWDLLKQIVGASTFTGDSYNHTFDYLVSLKENGVQDSAWKVDGTITVTNSNTDTSIPAYDASVTDAMTGVGGSPTCQWKTDGDPSATWAAFPASVSVASDTSKVLDYTCSFASQPTYSGGTNKATATWTGGSASSNDVAVNFAETTSVDKTVKVTDDKTSGTQAELPNSPVTYGSHGSNAAWVAADNAYEFPYSLPLTYDTSANTPPACQSYTNTAKVLGHDDTVLDTAQATAQICPTAGTWTVAKDVAEQQAVPVGTTLHYTLTAHKTSVVDAKNVVLHDDLSGIAPYITGDPVFTAPAGTTAAYDSSTHVLTWTIPTLGSTDRTLGFTVTVASNAYNVDLPNLVTSPGSDNCPDVDHVVAACKTDNKTPHYTLRKSSDEAGQTVMPPYLGAQGTLITYTLTVHNDSQVPINGTTMPGAQVTDDLSDVLDNATWVGNLTPSGQAVFDGNHTLTWTLPTIAAGADATLTYQVRVNADQWNETLTNVATPGSGGDCYTAPVLALASAVVNPNCTTTSTTPPYGMLQALKLDADTQAPLPGATFALYQGTDTTAAPLATSTSGADGTALFDIKLRPGTFTIVETAAPTGYDLPSGGGATHQVTLTESDMDNGDPATQVTFSDPPIGAMAVSKAHQELVGGSWVPSDGTIAFNDQVKYVMTVTATGTKVFHNVKVTDYVPGYNPADTQTQLGGFKGVIDTSSIKCSAVFTTCTTSYDAATGLVTWSLGNVGARTGTVEFVVRMPDLPRISPLAAPGVAFAGLMWNQAYLAWTQADTEGTHTLASNQVTDAANEVLPPKQVKPQHHPSVLPNTGGPDRWIPAAGLALLLAGVALVAGDRRRRHRS